LRKIEPAGILGAGSTLGVLGLINAALWRRESEGDFMVRKFMGLRLQKLICSPAVPGGPGFPNTCWSGINGATGPGGATRPRPPPP